jgi:hypothetical protein
VNGKSFWHAGAAFKWAQVSVEERKDGDARCATYVP